MKLIQSVKEIGGNLVAVVTSDSLFDALGVEGYKGNKSLWLRFRAEKLNLVQDVDFVCVQNGGPYSKKHFSLTLKAAYAIANSSVYARSEDVARYLSEAIGVSHQQVTVTKRAPQFAAPAHLSNVKTMSSVEIVEVINQLRPAGRAEMMHNDFLKKVREHPGIDEGNFSSIYFDQLGRSKPCYYLPKREAELMVMSESLEVQTKVYDRLAEFEAATTLKLPQTYAQALMELALTVQKTEALQLENVTKTAQIEQQTVLIEAQKPAVDFVDKYVDAAGLKNFRTVAKLLNAPEREFRNFLLDRGYWHRSNRTYLPKKQHEVAGRFFVKTYIIDDIAREQVYFTPKGFAWIAQLWNERVPVLTKKAPKIDESLYKLN